MDEKKGHPELIESEVICIDDESDSTLSLSKKSCSKKCHRKKTRKVKLEKNDNRETLVISQEVKVKKQKIQCIINLNNYCEYEETWKSKKCHEQTKCLNNVFEAQTELKPPKISTDEPKTPKTSPKLNWNGHKIPKKSPKVDLSAKIERIVPRCLRKRCRATISHISKCCRQQDRDRSMHKTHSIVHSETISATDESNIQYLSPISKTSLQLSPEPDLEDISSDSFNVCSDENLDTLIKRTKDRERTLSKSFEYMSPLKTSTPKNIEASDTETLHIRSEGDTSVTTFLLEPQFHPNKDLYSPSHPTSPEIQSENNFEAFKVFNDKQCEEHSPNEDNVKIECYNDDICMDVCHNPSKELSSYIQPYVLHGNANKNGLLKTNNGNTLVKNEVIETDLHAYRSVAGIKQEKKPSPTNFPPNIPILWIANKDLKETKYFNKFPNVMPNIKVENSVDFTTFTENHINLRIKTEVNVKHEL